MEIEKKSIHEDRFERKKHVDPTEPPGPASEGDPEGLTDSKNSPKSTTGGKRGSDDLSDIGHPQGKKAEEKP